jgi:hypothetical protein
MSVSPDWSGELAPFRSPFHSFLVIVIGTLVILLVGILVSRLRRGGPHGGQQHKQRSQTPSGQTKPSDHVEA